MIQKNTKLNQRFPIFEYIPLTQSQITLEQLGQLQSQLHLPYRQMNKNNKLIWKKVKNISKMSNDKFKTNRKLYKILSKTIMNVGIILNSQGIQSLEPFQKRQWKLLTNLQLNDNLLEDLSPLLEASMPMLQSLQLNRNKLNNINQISDSSWKNLKTLILSQNKIISIQCLPTIELTSIQILNLSDNLLTIIKGLSKSKNPFLKELDISSNYILNVDTLCMCQYSKLKYLNLQQNLILDHYQIEKFNRKKFYCQIILSFSMSGFDVFKRKGKSIHGGNLKFHPFRERLNSIPIAKCISFD